MDQFRALLQDRYDQTGEMSFDIKEAPDYMIFMLVQNAKNTDVQKLAIEEGAKRGLIDPGKTSH